MAPNFGLLRNVDKIRNFSSLKRSFTGGKIIYNKQATATSTSVSGDVPGLSNAVVKVPNEPVGPGATKTSKYKNPEYFCYDKNSFFEAELELLKYRCPQPSTSKPYFQDK